MYKMSGGKMKEEPYPSSKHFKPLGFTFTGMIPVSFSPQGKYTDNVPPTLPSERVAEEISPGIRPSIQIQGGVFYSPSRFQKLIRFIEAELGYKSLWYAQDYTGPTPVDGRIEIMRNAISHNLTLELRFNNTIRLSNHMYLLNGIGINADYRFLNQYWSSEEATQGYDPGDVVAQVNYRIGIGWITDADRTWTVFLQAPVLNITPSQTYFSQIDYFNSSFQTVSLGMKYMIFRPAKNRCPEVISNDKTPGFQNGYNN
jgi:hypothetical protein